MSYTVSYFLDHLDYVANLVGCENAGFGFDFVDYALAYLPAYERARLPLPGFETPPRDKLIEDADVPAVVAGMRARGYSAQEVERITGGNFTRIFRQVCG